MLCWTEHADRPRQSVYVSTKTCRLRPGSRCALFVGLCSHFFSVHLSSLQHTYFHLKGLMCAPEQEPKLNMNGLASWEPNDPLQEVQHSATTTTGDQQAPEGAFYYDTFLQSISNDITSFLVKQQQSKKTKSIKSTTTTTTRRYSVDDVCRRIKKRRSNRTSKFRSKHLKRRNSSPS